MKRVILIVCTILWVLPLMAQTASLNNSTPGNIQDVVAVLRENSNHATVRGGLVLAENSNGGTPGNAGPSTSQQPNITTVAGEQAYNVRAYGAKGDDTTDDTAAIQATINALPSCSFGMSAWAHCGEVFLPHGVYKTTSSININSPFVFIRGDGSNSAIVDFHGNSGCAIEWTSNPFNSGSGESNAGGIDNLKIDGRSSGPGTCGLDTYDIGGFRANGLTIADFTGSGSAGWLDRSVKHWNERFRIYSMELSNNDTSWKIVKGAGSGGTFGYGFFNVWINVGVSRRSGQTAVSESGGNLLFSSVFIIINGPGNVSANGIELFDGASWNNNLYNIHMELGKNGSGGNNIGINVDATSKMGGMGIVDEYLYMSDNISPGGVYSVLSEGKGGVKAYQFGIEQYPNGQDRTTAGFEIGSPSDCGTALIAQKFCEPATGAGYAPFGIYQAGAFKMGIATDGNLMNSGGHEIALPAYGGKLALSGSNGISGGTVNLSGGVASHSFATAYSSAPVCTASDQTRPAPVLVKSNNVGITLNGNGSDVVTWICTPAAN